MTGIQVAQLAVSDGCQLVRPRKGEPGQYDAKHFAYGNKRGWFLLDSFSASAIVAVHNALSAENQAKYEKMAIVTMAKIAFKLVRP